MTGSIRVVVPGQPVAKGRPRVTRKGHAYTPKRTRDYEKLVKECWISAGSASVGRSQVIMIINLYMKIPKSESKKKKQQMLAGEIPHVKKPDVDNIAKCIIDSLNSLAYDDDSQITQLRVSKTYSDNPRAEILIMNPEYERYLS